MAAERPTRDQALMETARVWAARSTCEMLHVGAVFSRDGRILAQGYNGAPAGMPHCEHKRWVCGGLQDPPDWIFEAFNKIHPGEANFSLQSGFVYYSDGRQLVAQSPEMPRPTCSISEHAERNGIAWAARNGVRLEGCELHVTNMPCLECAKSVINAGVGRVIYHKPYRFTQGVDLLEQAGIEVLILPTLFDKFDA